MRNHLSLQTKGFAVVALPVVLSIVFSFVLMSVLNDAEQQIEKQQLGAELGALTARLELSYYQAVTSATKFHSSRSEKALAKLNKAITDIEIQEKKLKLLLENKEDIKDELAQTLKDGKDSQEFLHQIRDGASTNFGGELQPRVFQSKGQRLIGNMMEDVGKLSDYARKCELAAGVSDSRAWVIPTIIIGIVLNILLAGALAIFLYKDIGTRLSIVRDNAIALATGQPLHEPLPDGDEIATLDNRLHNSALALDEAKRKENALIDNAVDVLCSIDSQLKFVRVSSAAARVWGYDPADLIGLRLAQLISEDSIAATLNSIEAIITDGTEGTLDSRFVRQDGKTIDVFFSAYWSQLEGALFCVVRDVTREREFERTKQKLMDTVAHDLRSPIASIRVVLDSLAMGLLGPQNDKAVARIQKAEKSADRLLRLINDLLDYDKFESGQFTLDRQDCSLRDIIDGALVALEGLVEQRKLEVTVAGDDLAVHVDADRMTQVFVNLLSNAIKFSPEAATLTINMKTEDQFAKVEILDKGPGIPDEMKPEIFQRFKQVEATAKTHKGTGLGLPIAKQIVEAHNGTIGVCDADGGGTNFWFTIKRVVSTLAFLISVTLMSAYPALALGDARTVTFAEQGKYSMGTIILVPISTDGSADTKSGKMLGPARGQFEVPPKTGLYLCVTPEGLSSLSSLSKLRPGDLYRLRMHNIPATPESFTTVGNLKGLVELDVGSTDASDKSLEEISKITTLQSLEMSRCLIQGKSFSSLKALVKLRELDLSSNRLSKNSIQILIQSAPQLTSLDLSDTELTDNDIIQICTLKHLQILDVSRNRLVTDRAIDSLLKLKNLKRLNVKKTSLSTAGVDRIRSRIPNCTIKS